ncbi:hypothetical protein FE257_002434, partial [Aspergillus nanangensis]
MEQSQSAHLHLQPYSPNAKAELFQSQKQLDQKRKSRSKSKARVEGSFLQQNAIISRRSFQGTVLGEKLDCLTDSRFKNNTRARAHSKSDHPHIRVKKLTGGRALPHA